MNRWKREQGKSGDRVCIKDPSVKCGENGDCIMRTSSCPPVKDKWVICPICGGKTRTKIRPDTVAKNLPILCRLCKNEVVVDIKDGKVEKAK